jgi:lipopolysaccharide/colanic/teichoic acid biosynthesis glycosyltransferase
VFFILRNKSVITGKGGLTTTENPTWAERMRAMIKRACDVILAVIGLVVCWPLFVVVAALIKLDSRGPILFKQERIGKGFRPFFIYKFRTMVEDAPQRGGSLTVSRDPRITRVGRILRQTKIDELPQLINVLRGDMSFVGPRPEVRRYVDLFVKNYETILTVRPGITDLASLKYRDESAILARSDNPEEEYVRRILPDKLRLAKEYVQRCSLGMDMLLILKTLLTLIWKTSSEACSQRQPAAYTEPSGHEAPRYSSTLVMREKEST